MIGSYILYGMILVLATGCGYRIEKSESVGEERLFRILLFLALWIPATLRYGIGTDYASYVDVFNYVNDANNIEIGFKGLCVLLNWVGADSFWLFAIVGAMTYVPFCFGLPRAVMFSSAFLFVCSFYLSTYTVIRQTLAVSLILYASYQLLSGNDKRFFLITVFASFFHLSVLLLLPFYIIRHLADRRIMVYAFSIIAVALILNANLVEFIFSNPLILSTSYGRYADSEFFTQEAQLGTGLGLVARTLLPVFFLFPMGQLKDKCVNMGYIPLVCIAFVVCSYLSSQVYVFNRLVDSFKFVPILCFGLLSLKDIRIRYKRPLIACFVLLYAALYFMDQYNCTKTIGFGGGMGIMPYQTIFDDMF